MPPSAADKQAGGDQVDRIAKPDFPADERDRLDRARDFRDGLREVGAQRPGVQQRDVAPPHDVQIHRVKCGGDEDAREQPVDLEPGVQDARGAARERAPAAIDAAVATQGE